VKIQRVEPNTERSVETQLATQGRVSAGAFSKRSGFLGRLGMTGCVENKNYFK